MSGRQPLISIVIPTRNRAHLLPFALRSALDQRFDDFEIVVVANNCHDNTRTVVQDLSEPRVRYVETDRTLTMPENWDFAWGFARGRYVTYLPDDDALASSAVASMAELAVREQPKVLTWHDASYYYPRPHWPDEALANVTIMSYCGDATTEWVDAASFQAECASFRFKWDSVLPKLLNCLVDREYFSRWRADLGTLFFPVAPDYSFAWVSSHVSDGALVINRPLTVRGISLHSIGSNAGLSESGAEFYREFGEFDFFAESPLVIPITLSHLAGTFARASKGLTQLGVPTTVLDVESMIVTAARQLKEVEFLLPGWQTYLPRLVATATRINPDVREKILEILAEPAPSTALLEPVLQTRLRTARMALDSPHTIQATLAKMDGDRELSAIALGLEPGVLAPRDWSSIDLIGDELGVSDPYEMSRLVDRYYDILLRGRAQAREKTVS